MSIFRPKPEEQYLAALCTDMDLERQRMIRAAMASPEPEMEIAESFARLVTGRVIAEIFQMSAPSRVAKKWVKSIDRHVLMRARKDAWEITEMYGLDMARIVAVAQRQSDRYLRHIGSTNMLAFEQGAPGYRDLRVRVISQMNPEWEQAAFDIAFEHILYG